MNSGLNFKGQCRCGHDITVGTKVHKCSLLVYATMGTLPKFERVLGWLRAGANMDRDAHQKLAHDIREEFKQKRPNEKTVRT